MTSKEKLWIKYIRFALIRSNDLRKPPWRDDPNPIKGHCYLASEAFYHLTNKIWKPMFIRHEGSPHWFLKHRVRGEILDLTSDQFKTKVPYEEGIGKGFLTKKPSKRCQTLLKRIDNYLKY